MEITGINAAYLQSLASTHEEKCKLSISCLYLTVLCIVTWPWNLPQHALSLQVAMLPFQRYAFIPLFLSIAMHLPTFSAQLLIRFILIILQLRAAASGQRRRKSNPRDVRSCFYEKIAQ